MSYARNVLKVFGSCLIAVLGLMAVSAVGAQAQTGWLVNGSFINSTRTFDAQIHPLKATAPIERHLVLSGEALGAKVKLLCEKLVVDDGLLFGEAANKEKTEGLATLLFSICTTFLNTIPSAICKPKEPIVANILFRAILHNSLTYILFEADGAGKPIALIEFPNPECVLFPERNVEGSVVAECLTEDLKSMEEASGKPDLCLSDLVHHFIREAPTQTLFGTDGLLWGNRPAKLEGIGDALLSGADSGKTWACHI